MKPHLVPADELETLEKRVEEAFGQTVAAAPTRLRALDRLLVSIGSEFSSILIIFLALAILCAPVGLGLAAIYFLAAGAVRETGHPVVGWIVAIAAFAFLCRYVWGTKLQRASRAAALALIAAKSN